MESNRRPNSKFVEWMKQRIKLVGEELIKRADSMTFEGFDAITQVNIEATIPTIQESGNIWPSLTFTIVCGEATMIDEVSSGVLEEYPPEQFVETETTNQN